MPKLGHRVLDMQKAIFLIMDLYDGDPQFRKDREEIRRLYVPLLQELEVLITDFIGKCRLRLPEKDFQLVEEYFYRNPSKNYEEFVFEPELSEKFHQIHDLRPQYVEYLYELGALATRWKMIFPWAIGFLKCQDMSYMRNINKAVLNECSSSNRVNLESEKYKGYFTFPDLEIRVSPSAFMEYDRTKIKGVIAKTVADYEHSLKSSLNLKESSSHLKMHAIWWFEHHVRNKSCKNLAKEFPSSRDETTIVNHEESIRRAISKFSKLLKVEF